MLFNCIEIVEVFPPDLGQEEKVLCDFCLKKNKTKHLNTHGQHVSKYFFFWGDVTWDLQPKIAAVSLPMLFASREWLVLLLETYLQS